jgi:hypothetical protein
MTVSSLGQSARPKRDRMTRIGWGLSILVLLFLALDGGIKLVPIQPVTVTLDALGWPSDAATARGLGILLLACGLLYALPRTAVLGAILLTAYLGGAVATHLRIASPVFSHVLFGSYIGIFAWLGLWLREPRLRALLPLRR